MSAFYTGITGLLMSWALGEKPDGVTLRVAAVDDSYVFNEAHIAAEITGVLYETELEGTLVDSTVFASEVVMTGLTPGDILQGFVFSFDWTGGSKPICFINQATDLNLPFTIVATQLDARFDALGVFKV